MNKTEQIREQLFKIRDDYLKKDVELVEDLLCYVESLLSEQRQSILEDIEKLSKELETIDVRDILKKMK